jgi:hypothetical protein
MGFEGFELGSGRADRCHLVGKAPLLLYRIFDTMRSHSDRIVCYLDMVFLAPAATGIM